MSTERSDLVKWLLALANCEANEVAEALNSAATRIAADEALLRQALDGLKAGNGWMKHGKLIAAITQRLENK